MEKCIIAIDGPASSGKSTIAKLISKELNINYIDTGAMYRAVTYYFLKNNIDVNKDELINLHLNNINITYKNGDVLLNDINIKNEIRKNIINQNVSVVAKNPDVRNFLVGIQRRLGMKESVIMDGRDVGTTIFPQANYKFYLLATAEERAKRRYDELIINNENVTYNQILKEVKKRDYIDSNRDISPLKKAEDAIEIDSTSKTIEEVVSEILKYIKI